MHGATIKIKEEVFMWYLGCAGMCALDCFQNRLQYAVQYGRK